MPRKPKLTSTLSVLRFESNVLKGNPLGDPHVREVPVYLPASYFTTQARRYPVVYAITGFTGRGKMLMNDSLWVEPFDKRVDELIRRKKMIESIVVFPDCATKFGGSQYLNSVVNGRYEDHLVKELVPYIDRNYRTIRDPRGRAIMGKSSGGYGAIVQGMRHPNVFGLVGCHSGDMYFELCYKPDFVQMLRELPALGGLRGFLKNFDKWVSRGRRGHSCTLNIVAMALAYSPRKGRRIPFELPFDLETGEMNEKVWREWLAWDPVYMINRFRGNLKKLKLLYIDAGTKDEYQLHYGARIFTRRLRKFGIRYVHEEFPHGHSNIQYRYDRSLTLFSDVFRRQLRLKS